MRRLAALSAALVVLPSCALVGALTRGSGPEPRPLDTAFRSALAPLYATGTTVTFLVRDMTSGATLAADRARALVTPASTQKLLTTAAAMHHIAADHVFETQLVGPTPDDSGVIRGNLWLVGGGDPSFGSGRAEPDGAQDRPSESDVLRRLAEGLRESGVERVTGDVIGDGRVLEPPALKAGWSWDDEAYPYSAYPGGLTYLEGLTELELRRRRGSVKWATNPATSLVDVHARLGPDQKARLIMRPGNSAGAIHARWRPQRRRTLHTFITVPHPSRYAAEQLARALKTAGIRVDGRWRAVTDEDDEPPEDELYDVIASPPLSALCRWTNVESLNLYAEVLLMQLGRMVNDDPTTRGGVHAVQAYLTSIGVDPSRLRIVDGSGLSRMNLLSSEALVAVLEAAWRTDRRFADTLSVAGERGTLVKRLADTHASGRVRAKTGTLTGHRNMAGYVRTTDGRTLAFSILLSGVVLPRSRVDDAVDQALLAMVGPAPQTP